MNAALADMLAVQAGIAAIVIAVTLALLRDLKRR